MSAKQISTCKLTPAKRAHETVKNSKINSPSVVFNIPCFGHHPVKPVIESTPQGTKSELESRPSALVGMALFVTSVTHMMRNHGPT